MNGWMEEELRPRRSPAWCRLPPYGASSSETESICHASSRRGPAMPPCSPEAATSPLRSSVTALAATAFIGGCVHSPHGTGRCKPPCRARRWAAGPPQRLAGGKPRILFLTSPAEPSPPSGQGEGLGQRPAAPLSDRKPLAEGGYRSRDGSRRRRAGPPRLIRPALTSLLWLWSEKPARVSPQAARSAHGQLCRRVVAATREWANPLGEVPSYAAKAGFAFRLVGRAFVFPVSVDDTWLSLHSSTHPPIRFGPPVSA